MSTTERASIVKYRRLLVWVAAVGWMVLVPGVASAQVAQPRTGGPAPQRLSPEHDIVGLYADARNDLASGRPDAAERRLEVLVARYPESPIAELARRDLKQLYARLLPDAVAPPAALPQQRPAVMAPPFALGRGSTSPASSASPNVQALAEQFRTAAGDRIFFSDGSADIGGRSRAALEAQAQWLIRVPQATLAIEGHADDRGTPAFNGSMAERRAEAVRQRLIELGIAPERLRLTGFGRDQPIAQCSDPACAAQNRRAVSVVTGFVAGAERQNGVTVADPRSGPARPADAGAPLKPAERR